MSTPSSPATGARFRPYKALPGLTEAIDRAKTVNPVKLGSALEGLHYTARNGEVETRDTDRQSRQPLHVVSWQTADGKTVRHDQENTANDWRIEVRPANCVASQPSSCARRFPAKP